MNKDEISKEEIKKIKKIVKFHYGFSPEEKDIKNINRGLKNNYIVLHQQKIINKLATRYASRELLKYWDKIGSQRFEEIWLTKIMFHYLIYASMSYQVGIPIATICLCRTAIESGLREKIAERLADDTTQMMNKIKELEEKRLWSLIKNAEHEGIISKNEIEKIFQKFKEGRHVLDKFIHGDIMWIKDFIETKYEDTEVIGSVNELEKSKIIANSKTDKIAFEILKCTYKLAETFYFKNLK